MSKIFVSYKYWDTGVFPLNNTNKSGILPQLLAANKTKVRDYVDKLQEYFEETDEINKGEKDGEDLGKFKDGTIESKLRDRIYDSTITLVLISKNMKEIGVLEEEQWIPWEISYSLKEITRGGRTSSTNALLAIVLPDENNSYEYFIQDDVCPNCHCRMLNTDHVFGIMKNNLFNHKKPEIVGCNNHTSAVYSGDHSYMHVVKWVDFIANPKAHINTVLRLKENLDNYTIQKEI